MAKKRLFIDLVWLCVSSFLTAIAVNCIFQFTGLAPGGITGLAIILSTISHIGVDIMTLCISVPLLMLGVLFAGRSFGLKTLFITGMTPLFMRLVPSLDITAGLFRIHPLLRLAVAGLLGGILVGTSIGIALNHGCSTGGTDLLAILIQKVFKHLKLSHILFALDGFVVVASGMINHNPMIAVFSLFSLLVIIQTIAFTTQLPKKDSLL